jgi:cell division protein FtsQ
MARKQARRRKQKQARTFRMPSIAVGRILTPAVAILIVVATYHVSGKLLDRPIESISVSGPLQRVTALQIEEAISDELDAGFFAADVGRMQAKIQALSWIDGATVARRWPNRIAIGVTEQVPAAIWGESGLLNVRGELFVTEARHIPAELPRLSGPDDRADDVARRYLAVREQLIPLGLDVRRVRLDARGAWDMTLANGVDIRFGRRDIDERTGLFLEVVASIITGRAADIEFVDMRYGNGFTIGWNDGAVPPAADPQDEDPAMLALRGAP